MEILKMPITLLLALKAVKTTFFKLCIMELIANFINYELSKPTYIKLIFIKIDLKLNDQFKLLKIKSLKHW